MSDKMRRISLGENPTKITTTAAGPFDMLYALTDATFTCNTNWVGGSNPETITVAAGMVVPGTFTNISVSAGTILGLR